MSHLREAWADHRLLRHWHIEIVGVAALVAAIALALAYHAERPASQRCNAACWLHRIGGQGALDQPAPPPGGPTLAPGYTPPPAQASYNTPKKSIDKILDQGDLGQCQCEAFAVQYDHLVYLATGHHVHYSCRFWYPIVTLGQDVGTFIWQYIATLANTGGVHDKVFDYVGRPDTAQFSLATAQSYIPLAANARAVVQTDDIALSPGAGENAVNACEAQLVAGRLCNLALSVYGGNPACNDYLDAPVNGGIVDVSGVKGCVFLGGHATVIRGYIRHHCIADSAGTWCHWEIVQNSWGPTYGINCTTLQPDIVHGGCVLVASRLVAKQGYSIVALTSRTAGSAPTLTRPPVFAQPGPNGDKSLPPPPTTRAPRVTNAAGTPWVYGVCALDVTVSVSTKPCGYSYDLAPALNLDAHEQGISPVFALATLGAECGRYTHSTQCDHVYSCGDTSFGPMQVTVATAAQFGIGNGSCDGYYGPNTSYVRGYENVANQGINLGVRVLGGFAQYERTNCPGAADGPYLYVAWNAGPGQPCWFLLQPTGQAGSNFYGNFLGWYRWAQGYAVYGVDPYRHVVPAPAPFPLAIWQSWCKSNHKSCPSAYTRTHRLTWPASQLLKHPRLGGKKPGNHWHRPRGRHGAGYTTYPYVNGYADCWPKYGTCKVVIHAAR